MIAFLRSLGPGWRIVVLLFPVALLNYFDRQMLASMKFSMMGDLPDIGSEANWGRILAGFKWTYAVLSPIGGYLADRVGHRPVIAGSLLAWSAVTWTTGQVTSFEALWAARAAMGCSEAFYIPAALALIAESHDASTRSRAVGAHQTGIYAGIILGGFCGYAAESPHVGWRRMFEISGVLGVLYALPLFLALPRTPAPTPSLAPSAPHDSLLRTVRGLVRQPPFLLLAAYFTLPAMAGWIVRDWMPAVLKSEFGIGQGRAGVSATLYWMTASVIGAFLGGWIADRWAQRNHRGRIYVSAIGVAATVVALLGVGYAPATGRLAIAVAFLVLFGLGWGVYDANNMPILAQILPARHRAAGYGCMNLVSIGCGGFADRWFGLLRDHHVPMPAIFGLFASLGMLAIALVLALRPSQTERARASNPS